MKSSLSVLLSCFLSFSVHAESNDSLDVLKRSEAEVQAKLDEFIRTDRHDLLLEARKVASSLNPRGDKTTLQPLDEGSLRLQLRVLLALNKARDVHFDPLARENRPTINVVPPLPDSNGARGLSGMDPGAIEDPVARKAYEDAIAANRRKGEKGRRELTLSRGLDYAVLDIWTFVRGFPANSNARKSALDIVDETLADMVLRDRIRSETLPGLGSSLGISATSGGSP